MSNHNRVIEPGRPSGALPKVNLRHTCGMYTVLCIPRIIIAYGITAAIRKHTLHILGITYTTGRYPKKVIREGGGYSELIRTAAKGADDSEEEEADALVVTADNFTAVMAMIGNLIERKDTFPKVVKALTGKNADKAAIRTFGDAMVELIPLFKQVEPAYLQQLDERSKNIDTMVTRMTSVAAAPSIVPPAAAPAPAVANQ